MTARPIALSAATTQYTPPALEGHSPTPVFTLREPVEGELDRLGVELFKRNVRPVDINSIRATMIDELYQHYDEAKADEYAGLIEQVWVAEGEHQARVEMWMEQERERLRDVKAGAPEEPGAEFPRPNISIRVQSRAQLIRDEIQDKSQRIRDITIRSQQYEFEQRRMQTRLYVLSWTGLKTAVEKDATGQALTEECLDALAQEIGPVATRQLVRYLEGLFDLTLEEVGNSDLPAESGQDQTISPAPSDASASSDGNSMGSGTEPTPSEGSPAAIADSSTSSSG